MNPSPVRASWIDLAGALAISASLLVLGAPGCTTKPAGGAVAPGAGGDARPTQAAAPAPALLPMPVTADRRCLRVEGPAFLEEIRGQFVLHLKGTPYEMGLQHGRLLRQETAEDMTAYVDDFALKSGNTMESLMAMWKEAEPHVPQKFKDELRGLAEGAQLPLDRVIAAHILPEKYHCSGYATWGKGTRDGKLYHYRSLDYGCHIGEKKCIQENACLILREPVGEVASAVVGWAGTIGCVSGMNAAGISVGEMGSSSDDESFAGVPMWFLLRDVLDRSKTLDEALAIMRTGPRTCGYNFIFTDGKIPRGVALEVTRSKMAVFEAGDKAEDLPPHWSLPHGVRRVNHFISPELATTQRKVYSPVESESGSWMGYEAIGKYAEEHDGLFDADGMVSLCRLYPPSHDCLHQAVFSPTDGRLWVANAVNPSKAEYYGAQNQTFYPYDLGVLLRTNPVDLPKAPAVAQEPPSGTAPVGGADVVRATIQARRLDFTNESDPKVLEALRFYDHEVKPFEATWKTVSENEKRAIAKITFPSIVVTDSIPNNTVHAKYFMPKGVKGRVPAVVILHHLGGEPLLEEVAASTLSQRGIAALMLWFPYYGERGTDAAKREIFFDVDLEKGKGAMRQAVLDVHRCGDWLAARPEVDPDNIGLLGISLGSVVGALVLGIDTSFSKGMLIIGGGDPAKIVFNQSKETKELAAKFEANGVNEDALRKAWIPIDSCTFAHRVRRDGVVLFNAKQDEVIPRACTESVWERMGKPEIHWYPATHTSIGMRMFDILAIAAKRLKGEGGGKGAGSADEEGGGGK